MKKKRVKKGYRQDEEILRMRVRAWVYAVKVASGLSLEELEREFTNGGSGSSAPRSCIWNKYENVKVVPRSGYSAKGSLNLVGRVEQRYPGTEQWLNSPLWRLADAAPMQMWEIREVYEGLPPVLRSIFILPADEATGIFWRRSEEFDNIHNALRQCSALRQVTLLELLVTVLALVKEAEIVQNQDLHESWFHVTFQVLESFQDEEAPGRRVRKTLDKYLTSRWNESGYILRIPLKPDTYSKCKPATDSR